MLGLYNNNAHAGARPGQGHAHACQEIALGDARGVPEAFHAGVSDKDRIAKVGVIHLFALQIFRTSEILPSSEVVCVPELPDEVVPFSFPVLVSDPPLPAAPSPAKPTSPGPLSPASVPEVAVTSASESDSVLAEPAEAVAL